MFQTREMFVRRAAVGAVLSGLLALLGCTTGRTTPQTSPEAIQLPHRPEELPAYEELRFTPPKPSYEELSNGIKVFVLENHELPIVNIAVRIRGAGGLSEPDGKKGVAYFTSDLLRRGGTRNIGGDTLDDSLGFLAAALTTSVDVEYAAANLNVMKKDLDTGISLLADVLLNPEYPPPKIDELKRLTNEDIRRRNDEPYEIGRRRFRQVVYGLDNPWARQLELEDVARITREDLVAFHGARFRPNLTYVAVAGDVNTEEITGMLRAAFGSWQRGDAPDVPEPAVGEGMDPGVYVIEKNLPQSAIRIGSTGMKRMDADEYAVQVMNYIFGQGTFTSRMGSEVRSNRGLSYYAFGVVFDSPDPRQGMLVAAAGPRAEKTHETIEVMLGVIDSMTVKPISDDEMQMAKETIINSFIFQYDSPQQIVGQQMALAFYGYPDDYLETYIQRIQSVTKDDVIRVARKYLKRDELRILVVGDAGRFDDALESFGPVKVLPSDDPVGTAETP